MNDKQVTQGVQATIELFEALIPLAATVTAMVGGSPVAVESLGVAQALLPVADQFLMQIGSKTITMEQAKDPKAIIAALTKDKGDGWPVLSFKPMPK